ncbi:hypothetical protein ACFTAO_37985 [Paenibacillus rhizoplanae]
MEYTTEVVSNIQSFIGLKISTLDELKKATNILDMAKHSPMPPVGWFDKGNISLIIIDAKKIIKRDFQHFLMRKKGVNRKGQ